MSNYQLPQIQSSIVLALVALALPISTIAEPSDSVITEVDLLSDLPIVTSASRMAQPLNNAPSSITIIDREMIQKSGAQTWVDLFRMVPGFQSYIVSGNRMAISSHDIGAEFPNHLEVMVDGRSVYEPIFSTVDWNMLGISLHDVERIEIVRGSNAAAYGSNAFLGAVNIITLSPAQTSGTTIELAAGSADTQAISVSHSNSLGALNYRVGLSFNHNDGFPSVSGRANPERNGSLDDSRDLSVVNLRGIYTPSLRDTLDASIAFSHHNTGWGDPDHPDEFIAADYNAGYSSVKWSRDIATGDSLKLHAYHNFYHGKNDFAPLASELLSEELGFPVSSSDLPILAEMVFGVSGVEDQPLQLGFGSIRSNRYDLEFENQKALSDELRVTWGMGFRHENIESDVLLGTSERRKTNSRRFFAHSEWRPLSSMAFNAGFMLENNNIVDTIASLRLGGNFHIKPNQTLRVSVAKAERSPSLVEAYEFQVDRVGPLIVEAIRISDPQLREEELTSYDLGYIARWPKQNLLLDIRIFKEELQDAIRGNRVPTSSLISDPSLDPVVKLRNNEFNLDNEGVEIQLDYLPLDRLKTRFAYTYTNYDGRFPDTREGRDPLDPIAKHTATLYLNLDLVERLSLGSHIYYMSDVEWDDGHLVDGFTRVDMQLSYRFSLGKQNSAVLQLIAQNIGDDYPEFNSNNVFDTRYFLNLNVELP